MGRTLSAAAAALALVLGLGTAGCAVGQAAANQAPLIEVSTGYVPLPVTPGTTFAYLAIRNNGPADRLISATTSAGGRVSFLAPAGPGLRAGASAGMSSVPSITIPARSLVRLVPDGPHLLITGAGRMRGGHDITLTLVFRHGGQVRVVALVANPAAGGGSYFFN
jgi:copper(I)-binding protein